MTPQNRIIEAKCFCLAITTLWAAVACGYPAAAKSLELDNGVVKVKADLGSGGAITWLSPSTSSTNLINNFDRGRQVQQSYYAGQRIDRRAEGQAPHWSPWPWNPIQVGDAYRNSATVLESSITSGILYTKTIPMLWDMKNEPAQAVMEQWTRLDGNVVHVRCKLTCQRTDRRWEERKTGQEMPAVYTIGRLGNQWTYVGDAPWTKAPLTRIVQSGPPWTSWGPTAKIRGRIEGWAANVDDRGWGVGVYYGKTEHFVGGYVGKRGVGGEADNETGYLSPIQNLALGKNSILEYEYDLILGTLDEIRALAYRRHKAMGSP